MAFSKKENRMDEGYQFDIFNSIDKRRLCNKIIQLRILVGSYVIVMLMSCFHNIIRFQIQDQTMNFCDIFRSIFRSDHISFTSSYPVAYLLFGEIVELIEIGLKTFYLNFLLLNFFDKESARFVTNHQDKGGNFDYSSDDEYKLSAVGDDKTQQPILKNLLFNSEKMMIWTGSSQKSIFTDSE